MPAPVPSDSFQLLSVGHQPMCMESSPNHAVTGAVFDIFNRQCVPLKSLEGHRSLLVVLSAFSDSSPHAEAPPYDFTQPNHLQPDRSEERGRAKRRTVCVM